MINLCYDKGNWEKLNTTLTTISKRHQQSRHAISAVIEKATEWIDKTPDQKTKVALLSVLREITDGKIYLEAERARLTRQVAAIKEVCDGFYCFIELPTVFDFYLIIYFIFLSLFHFIIPIIYKRLKVILLVLVMQCLMSMSKLLVHFQKEKRLTSFLFKSDCVS